jgi:hypothetical protein
MLTLKLCMTQNNTIPLIGALWDTHIKVIELLIARGADVNYKDRVSDLKPKTLNQMPTTN